MVLHERRVATATPPHIPRCSQPRNCISRRRRRIDLSLHRRGARSLPTHTSLQLSRRGASRTRRVAAADKFSPVALESCTQPYPPLIHACVRIHIHIHTYTRATHRVRGVHGKPHCRDFNAARVTREPERERECERERTRKREFSAFSVLTSIQKNARAGERARRGIIMQWKKKEVERKRGGDNDSLPDPKSARRKYLVI